MTKATVKKVLQKKLIVPEDPDLNDKQNNYTFTPSGQDITTEKGQGIESNKDIGHAMSLEDLGQTLAANSAENRTLN